MVVTTLTQLKRQVRWPYRRLCRFLGVPYGSFRRWKHRLERGQPAVSQPGPKKVAPLTLDELHGAVARLHQSPLPEQSVIGFDIDGIAMAGPAVAYPFFRGRSDS